MKKIELKRFMQIIYLYMKFSVFIIAVHVCSAIIVLAHPEAKAQNPLEKIITINLKDEPLKQALDKITLISGVPFTYNEVLAKSSYKISINAQNKSIKMVLTESLAAYPISFSLLDGEIFIRVDTKKPQKVYQLLDSNSLNAKYTLSGIVTEAKTGETIIGANIHVVGTNLGTSSNEYGFYSITLAKGNYQLAISAIGQKEIIKEIFLDQDIKCNIALEKYEQELQTVNIVAKPQNSRDLNSPQMGVENLSIKEIKDVPVLLGERDVVKTIQLLPGIKSAGEGSGNFWVRGGRSDQNLILLDEAPVYNATHLLGFFSTFNSDALKSLTVFKGDMPSQYGSRLSSVLDIKMNDGNNQKYGLSGGIGLISSRINLDGPIQKDKSSFLVSARRSYIDALIKASPDSTINNTTLYFYDLNLKANYRFGERDRLFLSGYFGKDAIGISSAKSGINWGNETGTLRWNHLFSAKLFSNSSLIFSNYNYKINTEQAGSNFNVFSQIRDWSIKQDFQWYLNNKNKLNFGFISTYHVLKPGEISATGNSGIISERLQNQNSLENAIYCSNTWKANNNLSLTYGFRFSSFTIFGPGNFYSLDTAGSILSTQHYNIGQQVKSYFNPEPRVAAVYRINELESIKVSYTRNTQNLHLLSNSSSSSPTDRWVSSTNLIQPETSNQYTLGFYKDLNNHSYEVTVEAYYKNMEHQIDYRNGANIFTNQPIETQLLYGKGRSFGIEFLFKKNIGNFTGWFSYTLSKTQHQVNGINFNNWYNARQDRTHDLAFVGIYKLSNKWLLTADWVFYTGDAITFPAGKYQIAGSNYYYYTERNGYRMPAYQRLDLSATKQLVKNKKFSSDLNFSLYNIYGYPNAFQIYFRDSKIDPNKTEAVRITLFTFVPSITYNFKF